MKQIKVKIDTTGKVEVSTEGYSGCGCVSDADFIKKALGTEIEMTTTAEYYKGTSQGTSVKRILKS